MKALRASLLSNKPPGIPAWLIVLLLASIYWVSAWTAAKDLPAVADEIAHLTGGESYWRYGINHLQPENGFMAMHWATLPWRLHPPVFPAVPSDVPQGSAMIVVGNRFFYESGNDPASMLGSGRAMIALVGSALVVAVAWWGMRLWGTAGGLLAALLAAFCPTLLAQGGIVMSDVTVSLFLLLTVTAYWGLLHRPSFLSIVLCGFSLGALLLSKMSGVAVFPMLAVLALVRWRWSRSLPGKTSTANEATPIGFQQIFFVSMSSAIVAGGVIWAAFGFRFSMFTVPPVPAPRFDVTWDILLRDSGFGPRLAGWLLKIHALPEAWLYGFAQTFHFLGDRPTFLNGEASTGSHVTYFPYAWLVKTPLTLFALMAAGLAFAFSPATRRRSETSASSFPPARAVLYAAMPLIVLFVVYWILALSAKINIGQRHLLPVYAPMFILAGGAAEIFHLRRRMLSVAVAALALLFVAESIWVRPNYLAYFNGLAGGPAGGYRHLLDSNVDVGQDLIRLRDWLQVNAGLNSAHAKPIFLSYFGPADPVAHGIQVTRFADNGFDSRRRSLPAKITGGVFCVSVTLSQGLYTIAPGPWTKAWEETYQSLLSTAAQRTPTPAQGLALEQLQFSRLRFFLTGRAPDARVGYSILIYNLSDQEVAEALYAPPAALAQTVIKRLGKS